MLIMAAFSFSMASLGATGLFQNDLGNFYGQIGYSAFPDLEAGDGSWRHAGHLKMTYSGLYPKLEAGLSFNESDATQYRYRIALPDQGRYCFVSDVSSFTTSQEELVTTGEATAVT